MFYGCFRVAVVVRLSAAVVVVVVGWSSNDGELLAAVVVVDFVDLTTAELSRDVSVTTDILATVVAASTMTGGVFALNHSLTTEANVMFEYTVASSAAAIRGW